MAKSSRASSKKANNARFKSKLFGPVETARAQRLSAKLLELASQPRPKDASKQGAEDVPMDAEEGTMENTGTGLSTQAKDPEDMDIDPAPAKNKSSKSPKGRIEKRKVRRRASIVFPRYKDGIKTARKSRKR